jgi:hypothetical protein
MNRGFFFAGLLGALATSLATASLSAGLAGCSEGRFPVCHTNADCEQRDAGTGNVCFSLRCVQCRYDADCAPGSVCGGTGTCSTLDERRRDEADGGPGELRSWDPNTWKECATGCKDQDCLDTCDRRFHAK